MGIDDSFFPREIVQSSYVVSLRDKATVNGIFILNTYFSWAHNYEAQRTL
jgi:hypothetical protein